VRLGAPGKRQIAASSPVLSPPPDACASDWPSRRPEVIRVASVRASDDPADLGVADFVLLAVKLWDTEIVLEQIKPVVGPARR